MNALVLNDTRREACRHHLGCGTVMANLLELCHHNGIHVVESLPRVDAIDTPEFHEHLQQVDAIIVNGEGTMHHDAAGAMHLSRAIRAAKAAGKVTALINTVWQSNDAANACLDALDFVHTRDGFSAGELRALGVERLAVAPDLCFYRSDTPSAPTTTSPRLRPPASCVVADSVHEPIARQLYDYAARHGLPYRVMQSWVGRPGIGLHPLARSHFLAPSDFNPATLMISGRFHAACLSLKHGCPFLVLPSNTHKIEALLHDAHLPQGDYLLPANWTERSLDYWAEHAADASRRNAETIRAFALHAHERIGSVFSQMVAALQPTEILS